MINAVIGSKGDMGKHLLVPLLSKLGKIREAGRNSPKEDWQRVWESDVIWLSIPRSEIPGVIKDIKLKPSQLLVEICSIKRGVGELFEDKGAVLSLHPLHGPHIPFSGQKWAVIESSGLNHPKAREILEFLESQKIQMLEPVSETEHDFMMSIVLSLPEAMTVVMDGVIEEHSKKNNQKRPSIEKIMEWAVPASNALFGSYIRAIDSSADWLREELVNKSFGGLNDSMAKALGALSKKLDDKTMSESLRAQRADLEKLPTEERARVKQWIEAWFTDATQKIMGFRGRKSIVPNFVIQKSDGLKEVLETSKKPLRVAIHGIEGSFTHESSLRLCDELKVPRTQISPAYLVEAQKVIQSVLDGQTDLGIFAVANSGSGVYVGSFEAMSKNNFKVLGIYGMEIIQCLLAPMHTKDISEIKTVIGHPQAVKQCQRTFESKYPHIKLQPGTDADDTALCAKRLSEGQYPAGTATLASELAAKTYGLRILEKGLQHDPYNTTSFVVITCSD